MSTGCVVFIQIPAGLLSNRYSISHKTSVLLCVMFTLLLIFGNFFLDVPSLKKLVKDSMLVLPGCMGQIHTPLSTTGFKSVGESFLFTFSISLLS